MPFLLLPCFAKIMDQAESIDKQGVQKVYAEVLQADPRASSSRPVTVPKAPPRPE